MLRDLRRAESDSELVFILTEKDILFLVQNLWDSRSAISHSDEVNPLDYSPRVFSITRQLCNLHW